MAKTPKTTAAKAPEPHDEPSGVQQGEGTKDGVSSGACFEAASDASPCLPAGHTLEPLETPEPGALYTMRQACAMAGLSYDTLKFYCNQALVPGVQRDSNNYRVFDAQAISWARGLSMLRRCGLSMKEMQQYVQLCLQGDGTVGQRRQILDEAEQRVRASMEGLHACLDFLHAKQQFYADVERGAIDPSALLRP